MTTRVLQDFDTLDNRSKSILDRLEKKNHQLTQASTQRFAHCRPDTGLGLHQEFSTRNKPKANKEIVSDEHDLLYKRLRKSLAVAGSMKGSSRSTSVEAGRSRVNIHPEKHTTHVNSCTGQSMCGGKEEVGKSFLNAPKKPKTLWPHSRSQFTMTWLNEIEKLPSLNELTKLNMSKALVGIGLGDTGISHWWSSSGQREMDAPFESPVPDGSVNTQQVQENLDNMSTGTSILHNKTEKEDSIEPVPLSFDDLLKRKDVKVLAPRLHKAFMSQQKASETYPVVYSTQQRQYEPFSSPGFHSLNPAPHIRKRSIRSAIILYTEAVQAKYMIRSMRERQTGESLCRSMLYTHPELKEKRTGSNCVNMHVLKADVKVIRSPDLELPLCYHDETPSVCASTRTNKISLIPKQKVISFCVGPVVNGMNPNQTCDSGKFSPAFLRPLPASLRRGLSSGAHTSTPQSWCSSSENKTDFLSISRPLKCSQNGVKCIIGEKQLYNGDWHKEANEPHTHAMAEVTDYDRSSVHDVSFSNCAEAIPSPQEPEVHMISTCSATDRGQIHKNNVSSCQPETINIPTADYLD